MSVLTWIFSFVAAGFTFALVWPFVMVVASRFRKPRLQPVHPEARPDFACIITAWRNAAIARPLVGSLLRQPWPHFHIYLVADRCAPADWHFDDPRLTVLHPDPPLDLKVKSIIHATEHFVRPHDFTLVFDADNVAHPGLLEALVRYIRAGWRVVQAQRRAKNLDTVIACADATGEFYKNYTERYVPFVLGSSAVISGSGMAVATDLYRGYLYSPEIRRGKELGKRMMQEDKILQNWLLRRDERIAWAREAIVYDEKVSTPDAARTQRSRWLFSYFQNVPHAAALLWAGLRRRSWNQFLFGLVTLLPPLFLTVGGAALWAVAGLWVAPVWSLVLAGALVLFALNVLWTLWLTPVPPAIWKALWGLPLFIWQQVRALFLMKNPDRNFAPTEHRHAVDVEALLASDTEREKGET